jgi:hypothetical protein
MENVTTRTTPRPDSSILHELAELEERQGWAHHVADAATGELLTTELSRPVAPLSRVERLARLGHQFDPSIFGAPTYRLTPRHPYQASPAGFLDFFLAHTVSTFTDEPEGRAVWALQNIVGEFAGDNERLSVGTPAGSLPSDSAGRHRQRARGCRSRSHPGADMGNSAGHRRVRAGCAWG